MTIKEKILPDIMPQTAEKTFKHKTGCTNDCLQTKIKPNLQQTTVLKILEWLT